MKLIDIAKELNLSISTVSKALNGAFDVSEKTRNLVINYAKAQGYKFKENHLILKNKKRIVMFYDHTNVLTQPNLVAPLSITFAKYARQQNFEIIIMPINEINLEYSLFLKRNHFDAAFIVGMNENQPLFNQIKDTTIPTVLYDNMFMNENISSINSDHINSVGKIITLLKEYGHTKIGFVRGDKKIPIENERFAGYILGLENNDLEYNAKWVYSGFCNKETGERAAHYFLDKEVSAIICSSDIIAIGLIDELQKMKKQVPEDISVTGFDDLEIARHFRPSITTITQNLEAIANNAIRLILLLLTHQSGQRVVINGELIIRESVAKNKLNKRIKRNIIRNKG